MFSSGHYEQTYLSDGKRGSCHTRVKLNSAAASVLLAAFSRLPCGNQISALNQHFRYIIRGKVRLGEHGGGTRFKNSVFESDSRLIKE